MLSQYSQKHGMRKSAFALLNAAIAGSVLLGIGADVSAQPPLVGVDGRYHPLNHMLPAGTAGYWAGALGKAQPGIVQPIRVHLPSEGTVTFYGGGPTRPSSLDAPADIGLAVGYTYRLKLSNMPEFPGVAIYPSIELIDRLHPPPGQAEKFPIPFHFTSEELEFAIRGRLVTKVLYLEQPQRAFVGDAEDFPRLETLSPHRNLIAEADMRGRPTAIVRIGGRTPSALGDNAGFFGAGPPLALPR